MQDLENSQREKQEELNTALSSLPNNPADDVPVGDESLNKEIFTICKSGKRSEKATRILSKFKIQSRSIEGGIEKVRNILCN